MTHHIPFTIQANEIPKIPFAKSRNPYSDKLSDFNSFLFPAQMDVDVKGNWQKKIFQNDLPNVLEIGPGYGDFMLNYSQNGPPHNYIAIDFRYKRSFFLAKKLDKINNKNFRFIRGNAEYINHYFAENELDQIFLFFPDPWPKKRHNKKRIFKKEFLHLAYSLLKPNAKFSIKTDHDDYFQWMLNVVKDQDLFSIDFISNDLWNNDEGHFLGSFKTRFEELFLKKNIKIKAMVLKSNKQI